ncbi:unnamed protein product [Choristocarpus tenellus]
MDQPSWMQETRPAGGAPAGSTSAASASGGAGRAGTAPGGEQGKFIRSIFHFINIGLSVMMAASAVLSLMDIPGAHEVFLALYLLIFGILLFVYEIVRVLMQRSGPHNIMVRNFGFFFGAKGRGLYLVFVGFLNFPLNTTLSKWTGVAVLIWGIVTVVTYMIRPEWFEEPKPPQTSTV